MEVSSIIQRCPDSTERVMTLINPFPTAEVSEWDCDDVCWWMEELGLKEYNTAIHVKEIDGRKLLELQPRDIQVTFSIHIIFTLPYWRSGVTSSTYILHFS